MITVEEAKALLFARVQRLDVIDMPVTEALGSVLAKAVFSTIDLPPFDQSAMDGYAIAAAGADQKQFTVIAEIKAGDDASRVFLKPGQAARIFTGAAVPQGADAIMIQEKAAEKNGELFVQEQFTPGAHIRRKSSEIRSGELALEQGTVVNPATVGFLAALGISKVHVYRKPAMAIIVTGNEIVRVGEQLPAGKIYEANSFSLHAALLQMGVGVTSIHYVEDDKEALKQKISSCLNEADILLLSGGISVGKYDFAFEALQETGVETIYYKIAQKPGKPMFAGKHKDSFVFALPGNPASALVCFYEYVYPVIRNMYGMENGTLPSVKMKLLHGVKKSDGRAVFVRAKQLGNGVMPLERQDSNMLRSFAAADAFIYLEQERQPALPDEEVEVHLLPVFNHSTI
jgi:molybdopterin molybdotransferase